MDKFISFSRIFFIPGTSTVKDLNYIVYKTLRPYFKFYFEHLKKEN